MVSNFNIMKTLTSLVFAGLFWFFHDPLNCDMDHRIFNMHVIPFNMCYIHSVDPDLYSHPKDLSQCTVCGLCAI